MGGPIPAEAWASGRTCDLDISYAPWSAQCRGIHNQQIVCVPRSGPHRAYLMMDDRRAAKIIGETLARDPANRLVLLFVGQFAEQKCYSLRVVDGRVVGRRLYDRAGYEWLER